MEHKEKRIINQQARVLNVCLKQLRQECGEGNGNAADTLDVMEEAITEIIMATRRKKV